MAFVLPPFSEVDPEKTHLININSMQNMISLAEKYTPTIPFVFASSTTVFAPPSSPTAIIDIHHPTEGISQYTKDKITCENMLRQSSLDWRILRLSVIMNPTFRPKKESVKYGLLIALDTLVEPIHVEDVAVAFHHAVISPNASHKLFIISGGERVRMTYRDYVFGNLKFAIKNITEKDIPWHMFTGEKKNYLHWYDTRESQFLLNYQNKTFDDFLNDARNNLHWWEKLGIFLLGKKAIKHYFS